MRFESSSAGCGSRARRNRRLSAPFAWPWLALAAALALGRTAGAAVTVPDPGTFVVDQAHVLDAATAQQLEGWLKTLADKTTAQVKLLTVPTTDGEPVFNFAQRQFDLWKLGQKKTSNGVLIVLALAERKVRIHTGYGLEGALPDSWCGTLERKVVAEYFRRGAYAEGLRELTIAVVQKVAAEFNQTMQGVPPTRLAPGFVQGGSNSGTVVVALLILVVILVVVYVMNRKGIGRSGSYSGGGWSGGGWPGGGGGDWGGGGGSFGGGGGSFGGGGSSGGGGAEAGW